MNESKGFFQRRFLIGALFLSMTAFSESPLLAEQSGPASSGNALSVPSNAVPMSHRPLGAQEAPRLDINAAPSSLPIGRLLVLDSNPRYFTDGTGKTIYLTGSHEGWELQDNAFDTKRHFDFTAYLDFLQAHNHNLIRMWTVEITRTGRPGTCSATPRATPMPYARSKVCCALDGLNKFNLHRWNPAYFARLRQRVIAAGQRGIYVSYLFFDGFGFTDWLGHPYNRANNINGVNGDTNGNGSGYDDVHTLASPQITRLQEAYVRKVIDTLSDLDNVLWQVANETGTVPWLNHFVDFIHHYEANKQHHLVNITDYDDWSIPTAQRTSDLYASNAEFLSPHMDIVDISTGQNSKSVVFDTDHGAFYVTDPTLPWKILTRGNSGLWVIDDSRNYQKANSPFEPLRKAMGYARRYAETIDLAHMTPRDDLTSTTYALANPGSQYLIYQPTSQIAFTVQLMAGVYSYEWFDPSLGAVVSRGTVGAPGGEQTFTPPETMSRDAVLYLKKALEADGD